MAVKKDFRPTLSKINEVLNKASETKNSMNEWVQTNVMTPIENFRDMTRRKPTEPPTRFKKETKVMENMRRDMEQAGHRKFGVHVLANERSNEETLSNDLEMGMEQQSSLMENPLLDSQRFDGIDPNVNPKPDLSSTARKEFDNAKREQEMEKQLRLGLMPGANKKFNPKPDGF
jgi:hypothetical protein